MAHAAQAIVLTPPDQHRLDRPSVFLSGSSWQPVSREGAPTDWRSDLVARLAHLPIALLNPQRADWASLDAAQLQDQIAWEMDYLERADVVAVYLGHGTTAPVSMFELGLHAKSGKVVVCCSPDFQRKDNVLAICRRFHLALVHTVDDLAEKVAERISQVPSKRP